MDNGNQESQGSEPSKKAQQAGSSSESELKRSLMMVGDVVLGAAVLVYLGVLGGNWLDEKLHSQPWCSIGLSLLGACLGLARMVWKATRLETENKQKER